MRIHYLKMQGAGNQIVVVDQRQDNRPTPTPDQIRRLSNPATGPGFDQLMWVGPAENGAVTASYRVFNADGSEVEQCGNGVRCVAWMLAREDAGQQSFRFDSLGGRIEARILDDGRITVSMGAPVMDPARIPFVAEVQSDRYTLAVAGRTLEIAVVSMGNPHCVIEVPDVAAADVGGLGPLIERDPHFPARTNVGFMHVRDRTAIDLRVYERGVGETGACGTGACAAFVVARRRGLVDDQATVHLPGGQLVVSWRGDAETVWLTGDAELLSEGSIDI